MEHATFGRLGRSASRGSSHITPQRGSRPRNAGWVTSSPSPAGPRPGPRPGVPRAGGLWCDRLAPLLLGLHRLGAIPTVATWPQAATTCCRRTATTPQPCQWRGAWSTMAAALINAVELLAGLNQALFAPAS